MCRYLETYQDIIPSKTIHSPPWRKGEKKRNKMSGATSGNSPFGSLFTCLFLGKIL